MMMMVMVTIIMAGRRRQNVVQVDVIGLHVLISVFHMLTRVLWMITVFYAASGLQRGSKLVFFVTVWFKIGNKKRRQSRDHHIRGRVVDMTSQVNDKNAGLRIICDCRGGFSPVHIRNLYLTRLLIQAFCSKIRARRSPNPVEATPNATSIMWHYLQIHNPRTLGTSTELESAWLAPPKGESFPGAIVHKTHTALWYTFAPHQYAATLKRYLLSPPARRDVRTQQQRYNNSGPEKTSVKKKKWEIYWPALGTVYAYPTHHQREKI